MELLEKYLKSIELSDKEIKVYVSALELGESTVIDISKKSRVNRTTIYPVIDSLQEKGLVSLAQKGKKICTKWPAGNTAGFSFY